MADVKQLKTITIDGVTFGMQEGLGISNTVRKTITNFPTSWSWRDGARITLKGPGTYYLGGTANFPNGSTTGARQLAMCFSTSGGGSWYNRVTSADNVQAILNTVAPIEVNNDLDIWISIASNKGVSGNSVDTTITAVPLVRIPTT